MSDTIHHAVDLDLQPAEASGLVASGSAELRERLGWDRLYWTILDDDPVERCFVARFHEDDVAVDDDGRVSADLHLTADPFVLHRSSTMPCTRPRPR